MRLIVRRTRLVGPQAKLWPDWRHHACVTKPHRHDRRPRHRPPPPRRGRDRHPRPQRRLRTEPLPIREVLRQLGLGRDRHPGPQPPPLDRRSRLRHHRADRGQDDPPPLPHPPRPAHSRRSPPDAPPPRPLALAPHPRPRSGPAPPASQCCVTDPAAGRPGARERRQPNTPGNGSAEPPQEPKHVQPQAFRPGHHHQQSHRPRQQR